MFTGSQLTIRQQAERDWVLAEFKSGRSPIMLATDVASRGLGMFFCGHLFPRRSRRYPGRNRQSHQQMGHSGRHRQWAGLFTIKQSLPLRRADGRWTLLTSREIIDSLFLTCRETRCHQCGQLRVLKSAPLRAIGFGRSSSLGNNMAFHRLIPSLVIRPPDTSIFFG